MFDEGLFTHIHQNPPLISGRILVDSRYVTTLDLTLFYGGCGPDPYLTRNPTPEITLFWGDFTLDFRPNTREFTVGTYPDLDPYFGG